MKAYLCVYRHRKPNRTDWTRTEAEAEAGDNPLLRSFLESYEEPGSVLDWGDDPSFFAASRLLGDARYATWGVCRRDVRGALEPGDFVVFVCARQSERAWDYHFVGVATLGLPLNREAIWADERYAIYREFMNVLARPSRDGQLEQYESVHRFHDDWRQRCRSPYWLFDPNETAVNLHNPLHIATYDKRKGGLESWLRGDQRVRQLQTALMRGAPTTRGLRSSNAQRPHPKLNLTRGYPTEVDLRALRCHLVSLMECG